MLKIFSKVVSGLIIAFLLVVVLFLIASVVPVPGNIRVFNVLTGSMEPTIKAGSMVVVRPAENYKIGDIITFNPVGKLDTTPITHRIHEMKVENGNPVYITKGDANEVQDLTEIRQNQIIGKMIFRVPFIGAVVNVAKTPIGFTLLIIVPAVIFIYEELKKIYREIRKSKTKKIENEQEKN
jgi:signal peptidase